MPAEQLGEAPAGRGDHDPLPRSQHTVGGQIPAESGRPGLPVAAGLGVRIDICIGSGIVTGVEGDDPPGRKSVV